MDNEKIDLTKLDVEVNDLVSKRLLAKIDFKGITPWWGGDYEGYTSSIVDEDEISGKLRWFLRTIYNRFCVNNLTNYSEAESRVSKYLGSTSGKSIYTFKIRNTQTRKNFDYNNLQRLNLVLSNRQDQDRYVPIDVIRFTLEIFRDPNMDNKYDEIIVDGILITLAFLGIGKGTNRGFGRFIPINCNNLNMSVCNEIIRGDVKGAFNKFYDIFKRIEGCNRLNQWINSTVPLSPLTTGDVDSISETTCTNNNIIQVLDTIQSSLLKSTLKTRSYNINIRDPGPFIHTWIYGLPRHSKVPRSMNQNEMDVDTDNLQIDDRLVKRLNGMGYFNLKNGKLEEPRRQSMFVISPVFVNNTYKIYVIPFLSLKDNEEETKILVHKGIHSTQHIIHLIGVQDILSSKNNSLFPPEDNIANYRPDLSFGNVQNLIKEYRNELILNINKQCNQGPIRGNRNPPKTSNYPSHGIKSNSHYGYGKRRY